MEPNMLNGVNHVGANNLCTLNGALLVRNSIPGTSRSHVGKPLHFEQESVGEEAAVLAMLNT